MTPKHILTVLVVALIASCGCSNNAGNLSTKIHERIEGLEKRIEERATNVANAVDGIEEKVAARIDARLKSIEERIENRIKSRMDSLENRFGDPKDDAMLAGLTPADLPQIKTDLFKKMDGGIELGEDEVMGRNAWNVWTGGSQVMLDSMARESFGLLDIVKVLDSRKRDSRFREIGLINEPGFRKANEPDEFGLWIDQPVEGVAGIDEMIAAEGIDPKVYGKSTGILGLRMFPNPNWDEQAAEKWDVDRFNNDPEYYTDPDLVRPYMVGMTCGICHIAHHPLNPPENPEAPAWENLSSTIANQYFREGKVFASTLKPGSFLWEMINAQPPGTSDTSRIATDHINNPNAINAIFLLGERARVATQNPMEVVAHGARLLPGDAGEERHVPHILKDGSDSIGIPGATIRVYVNIGLFSQQWLKLHNPLVGVTAQRPFEIEKAQQNSTYWLATEERLAHIAKFFTKIKPFHLADAPGGAAFIDETKLDRGKEMFAENCARCHSSKQPAEGETWEQLVKRDDFLDNNFLSDEKRYPVTELETNSARALGTNAKRGHIWDNFSSETYKSLPSVGTIEAHNLLNPAEPLTFKAPAGGVGYYRTPSLISIWTSAPFLHNNAVGEFTGDPSVAGRMKAFDDAIEKLLWPEKRLNEGSIWNTTQESFLHIPGAVLPVAVRELLRPHMEDGYFKVGPIPKGTPMNLLLNLNLSLGRLDHLGDVRTVARRAAELAELGVAIKAAMIRTLGMDSDAAREVLKEQLVPTLLKHSNCPDLVEDRGHYFGTDLADEDKRALIEFLKTL